MTTAAPPKSRVSVHPVTEYARDVADGRIIASRLVRLACRRHLRDLEDGAARGLWFDERKADDAIKFFTYLELAEGAFAGKPFTLRPWQQFIVGCLFGWQQLYGECHICEMWSEVRPTDGLIHCEACYPGDLDFFEEPRRAQGLRRFRYAYIEIAKGNGKSPMGAGIMLKLLVADGEPAAEVYTAAVNGDQAMISFRDAKLMAEASKALSKRLRTFKYNIAFPATNSFFRPLSSEGKGLDGKRPHGCLIDEIHAHPTDIVVEKMRAGTKGRRQALIVGITNSGFDRQSICYQHHQMSERVLEGVIDNDAWFAYVCGLDPCDSCRADGHSMPQDECANCDSWLDEAVWQKANPNLGVSITVKYLREQVAEAVGMPAKQSIVKRLNFCIWTQGETKWINADDWEACGAPLKREGACYGGYDLASNSDLTAFVTLWGPDADGFYDVGLRAYVPELNVAEQTLKRGVPYELWEQQGYLTATPGNVVDYAWVRKDIKAIDQDYSIREIGGDPWNATQFQTWLSEEDGFDLYPIRQGFADMTGPAKELEKLVKTHKLRHGGNPIFRWAAANVVVELDAAGNIKPSKAKSSEKIDPITALLCALSRALVHVEEEEASFSWASDV